MFGTGELIVILVIVLVLFGGKKLPELARSIGLGVKEFKKACNSIDDEDHFDKPSSNRKAQKSADEEPVTIDVEAEPKNRR